MARQGQSQGIWFIIGIVLAMLLFFLAIYFYKQIGGAWEDLIECPAPTDEGYYCALASQGCGDEGSRVPWKIVGCSKLNGKRRICCSVRVPEEDENANAGPPTPQLRLYEAKLGTDGKTIVDMKPLPNSGTFRAIATNPVELILELSDCVGNCSKTATYRITYESLSGESLLNPDPNTALQLIQWETVDDSSAENALELTRLDNNYQDVQQQDIASSPLSLYHKGSLFKAFKFSFPSQFTGETFKFTVKLLYKETDDSPKEEVSFVQYFTIKPAVRIGGLTSKWERSKTVTVVCEPPVKCQNVYYQVINGEEAKKGCGLPSNPTDREAAQQAAQQHQFCLLGPDKQTIDCRATHEECVDELLTQYFSDDEKTVYNQYVDQLVQKNVPIELLQLFEDKQDRVSMYSCVESLPPEEQNKWVLARRPVAGQDRWRFTLDKPYMTNQYLCVAGESTTGKLYSAGKPVQLKIDRIPPTGSIKFNPLTLQLRFTCDDNESGCEEYVGLAYINRVDQFFTSIFNNKPQRAVTACPPYEQGGAYQPETRAITTYRDNAVRVLCMRVVDRAGNAGVTMKTVFNSWQMLAAFMFEFVADKEAQVAVPHEGVFG